MTDQLPAEGRRPNAGPDGTGDTIASESTPPVSTASALRRSRFGRVPRDQRISKWDRPPEPHDWRFYVGTVGKVLIVTGLLIFGFVAYQLWGTGIETAIAQNRLEERFDTLVGEIDVADAETPPSETPSSGSTVTTDVPAVDTPAEGTEASDTTPPATDGPDTTLDDVSSTVPVAVDLSDGTVDQDPIPAPTRGEPLLRLEIPAIGRDDIVVPGVTLNDLQDGPGHYPDTPLPGQLGNAAIAGHRTTYGAPFFDIDQLEPGDEIIATLLNGDRFVYEVTSTQIVSASDYWVVTTRNPDIAELTLTSCHPKYTARERIVVHSVLNPEKSSDVGLPTFYTLDGDGDGAGEGDATIDVDDPVLSTEIDVIEPDSALGGLDRSTSVTTDAPITASTDGPTADTTADTTIDTTVETSADTSPGSTTGSRTGTTGDGDGALPLTDEEPADARAAGADPTEAFSRGWFDDRGAFLQIALWGLALVLVSLLARRVSRRYRRDSIGILVGVLPFVVALYFFYQNVNRLLPPGI